MIRAAEHLGARARDGWVPEHTLVIGLWDAEEFGLIGSTEWGEAHADELTRHGLVYVNADAAVGGARFGASGTPGMLGVLRGVLERTQALDPAEGTLWEQWCQSRTEGEPRLGLPGSGSDFAVFLHHLSLPVLDIGFGGNSGGQYHTAIDDFAFAERFLDPGFAAHELAGRFAAELLAELATAPAAGFDAAEAARELARIVREAGAEGAEEESAASAWLGVERAEELARVFDDLAQAAERARAAGATPAGFYARLACAGLPERPWFRNRLWAPGLESGYRSETLPTLRRAAAAGQGGDPLELAAELSDLALAAGELGQELAREASREGGRAGAGP